MSLWNETPLFWFLLLFIAGILLAVYFPCSGLRWLVLSFSLLICFSFYQFRYRKKSVYFRNRWKAGFTGYSVVFISGYLLACLHAESSAKAHFRNLDGAKWFVALVEEPPVEKDKSFKTILRIRYACDSAGWKSASGNCLSYIAKDSLSETLVYGDLLAFSGLPAAVSPPANPDQFDYKKWLAYKQVYDQVYIPAGKWKLLEHHRGSRLQAFSYTLRESLLNIFRKYGISGQDYAVLSALILGYEDDIDQETVSAYAAAGALHVLSVSGLHVGIIFVAINFILGFLNRNKYTRLVKSALIVLFLWFYALLTGLSPSVLRSATMLTFIIIGKSTRQHTSLYNTVAASAFFLLGINPYLVMQVGFQLSYAAVLGIIFLQPAIHAWLNPPGWLLRQVWGILSVSIAAQLATFPVGLNYFHQFPVYFMVTNLIVIPVSTLIIYGGIGLLALSGWPAGAMVAGHSLGLVVHFMNTMITFIEGLSGSVVSGIFISVFEMWMLYGFLLAFVSFLFKNESRMLAVALTLAVVLLAYRVGEEYRNIVQRQMVVFNIKGKSFLNIMEGKTNYVLTDASILADRKQMQFNVYNYWWKCGQDEKETEIIADRTFQRDDLLFYRKFLLFDNIRIALVADTSFLSCKPDKMEVDLVILSGKAARKLSYLRDRFIFNQLIIDSSVPAYLAERLMGEAKQLGLSVHSVQHQGAFVYHHLRD